MTDTPSVPWTIKDVFLVFIYAIVLCAVVIFWAFLFLTAGVAVWSGGARDTAEIVRRVMDHVPDVVFLFVFYISLYLSLRSRIFRRYNQSIQKVFFSSSSPLKDVWSGVKSYFVFSGVFLGATLFIFFVARSLDSVWGVHAVEGVDAFISATHLEQAEVLPIARHSVGIVLVLLLGPFFEELLFRGCLYRAMRRRFSFWPAAVLSSLAFAVLHGYFFLFFYIFIFGLALTSLYERRGNLIAPLTFHALNNGVVLTFFFLSIKR